MTKAATKVQAIDEIFVLDRYQWLVMLFNEALTFTMLSNVVYNIFGTAPAQLSGCDGTAFNETQQDYCQLFSDGTCKQPLLKYEFYSANVEFEELCLRGRQSLLGWIIWNLGFSSKARFSTILQMVGLILGSAISGHLSDAYGRKKVTLILLICMLIFSMLSSYSSSMDIFVLHRFFIGAISGGLITVGMVLVVENLPAKHRLWMCTVVTWAPNYMVFAYIAYLTGNWRYLARVCNVATAASILLLAFGIPESPKYLIQKHRKSETIRALQYINNFKNDKEKLLEEEIESVVDRALAMSGEAQRRGKKYTFRHLYSTKSLSIRTIVLSFGTFSVSYITYGLIFNLHVIQGSLFWNAAFSGLLRWIIGALVALIDHLGGTYVGRKFMHFFTVSVVGTCMMCIFLLEVVGESYNTVWMIRMLTLIAFGTTGCIFLQFLLVTAEVFPTAIRNIANSHIQVCGRLGNVFGPLAFSFHFGIPGFPYLVMASLALLDIILFRASIPETKGNPLPSEMPSKKKTIECTKLIDRT